ncbi:MAG: preprotein translocase subunit YajC [Clostridia bacterium]|nr:preprotein translocase subunit YajC [Clostridia bacterium]
MFFNSVAFLADGAQAAGTGSLLMPLILIGGMILILWWSSRSRKKQEREVQDMRDSLVVGDEITTIGGIIGKITSIKEETCIIETGRDKCRIRILKSAVRCVDVPNEAAREAYAAQRAAEAEAEAAEKAAAMEAERAKKLEMGKKKKSKKAEAEVEAPAEESEKTEG